MGYNATTGKITPPVRLPEVGVCLGLTQMNDISLTAMCRHANVNKWSKRKPIEINQRTALTDAQFAGNANAWYAGVVYGMHCGIGSTGALYQLHQCDYEYAGRPTTYCRLTDFNGYNHKAKPNVQGMSNINATDTFNPATQELTLYLSIDGGNSDSVRLNDLLAAVSPTSLTLEEFYPAVLIGQYAHVLYNSSKSITGPTITRVKQNNVTYNQFYIPLNESSTPSAVKTAGSKQVTFFLIEKYACSQYNIEGWKRVYAPVSGVALYPMLGMAFTIPNMVAITSTFGTGSEQKVLVSGIVALPIASNGIQVSYTSNSIPASQACTFSVSVRFGSTTRTKSVTKPAGTSWSQLVPTAFSWTEFGFVEGGYPRNKFFVTATVTYNGAYSDSKTQEFDWTP